MADTHKAAASPQMPVSEDVQEQIHFDTLWATTQAALELYAGHVWSAREDDDPGVTLLQAFAYGVSDVSYRHTLPLIDVLTETPPIPEPATSAQPPTRSTEIFSSEFGPERALTSSPVTLEDYRRAILDLTIDHKFCFRDVQIAVVPLESSYQYYYNSDNYSFQFTRDKTGTTLHQVLGQYWLSVTPTPGIDESRARNELLKYLQNHRNLCEKEIVPQPFVAVKHPKRGVQLFLEDDLPEGKAMVQAVAQALWAINLALLPAAIREPAVFRLARGETAEQVYAGPRLEHGWISHLPPSRQIDKGQLQATSVPVHKLSAAVVGLVPGVNAVNWENDDDIQVPKDKQVQLWVKKDGKLRFPCTDIKLYKRGQLIAESRWANEVKAAYDLLNHTAPMAEQEDPRELPRGRHRNPGFYRTVGASLPPVYGLQQAAEEVANDNNAKNLLQFLRPFEQLLANSADQLKKLPRLLAFDGRDPDAALWGAAHWPQKSDDPLAFEQAQQVLGDKLLGELNAEITRQSQDNEKELEMLHYLLGYFGEHRAPRALNASADADEEEFRHVQQGFLRQVTRLAYERASISISRVSALQRKVAARLGVGEALFDESLQRPDAAFPEQTLPFYMIEHQELLPHPPQKATLPSDSLSELSEQKVSNVKISEDKRNLTLTLMGRAATNLKEGQLIELSGNNIEPLTALMLHKVNTAHGKVTVSIELGQQTRLSRCVPLLTNEIHEWHWRLSQVWLKRVVYELVFATPPADDEDTAILKVTPSFPVELTPGKRFALRPRGRWLSWPTPADIHGPGLSKLQDVVVEVDHADPIRGTVKVVWIAKSTPKINDNEVSVPHVKLEGLTRTTPNWKLLNNVETPYAWAMPYTHDSFAFTLSIVLNRTWLKDSKNPEALSQWIQDIVREEMPSHLKLQLHWLDEQNFYNFANKYREWQKDSRPVGDQSFELLRLLGIGDRPVDERTGIGFVRIVSTAESNAIEARTQGADQESLLKHESVVYVRGY